MLVNDPSLHKLQHQMDRVAEIDASRPSLALVATVFFPTSHKFPCPTLSTCTEARQETSLTYLHGQATELARNGASHGLV